MTFVRFRSPTMNSRGAHVGVFALANGLRTDGRLADEDAAWLAKNNGWFAAAYAEPTAAVFDRAAHPITECWFRSSATHLLDRVGGYLELLDRYGEPWERVVTDDPGIVLFEDPVQIVVAPLRENRASPRC